MCYRFQIDPPAGTDATSGTSSSQTLAAPPGSTKCEICGKIFGSRSIKIHEPQCRKKRNTEAQATVKSQHSSAEKRDRPNSSRRPPMFPCYLCGRLFGVSSISIHEPQCLKKWNIENEKLPPEKRRQEPQKPDIKLTPEGNIDFEATSEISWKSHLNQLVACGKCGRTFNPDRVEVHEKNCKAV